MPTPLSTTGASSESRDWQELEDVFSRLGDVARSAIAPQEFYRVVLEESIRALSALGGAVWLQGPSGAMQPVVQIGWPVDDFARDEATRAAHESLLAEAAAADRVRLVLPQIGDGSSGNPTEHALLLASVRQAGGESSQHSPNSPSRPLTLETISPHAIVELVMRAGASPATYRGWEQFLAAVCDLASDFHTRDELRQLQQADHYRSQLLGFGHDAHCHLRLAETAYTVANEGRRIVGCNRLSVLVARGRRCRLLATSGVSRPERRGGTARRLESLAELVRQTDEPAYYDDGDSDALPPVAEALEQHAEDSHARQIAAVPLRPPADPAQADFETPRHGTRAGRRRTPQFVLVAEQFDARDGELSRERVVEVAAVSTTALYNALEHDRLPLVWLLRPLGAAKRQVEQHLPRTIFVAGLIASSVAALVFVPADFNIESSGELQPVIRRDVFAPRNGLVDEVLVEHGADVAAGQALATLRDPSLELELKRVDGELEMAQRQLDAVRATRTNRAVRDANPVDAYRLSAEEREIEQRLANLRRELELLNKEREELVVVSPIAGRVLTWDVANRLAARPVERGEVLVTVADLSADWQLELDVPDDRIGYVLAAQRALQPDLPVRFRLSSDDRERHAGHITEVCQTADAPADEAASASPTVLVKVAVDAAALREGVSSELRPGVSARAQIECGRRPIGYVWLHDIWDTAMEWLQF